MRKLACVPLLFGLAFCSTPHSGSTNASLPGHGAIRLEIIPNPIVAKHVAGNTYEFPFDAVVRETGGRGVTVTRVSIDVYAPGGIRVWSDSWDAEKIKSNGFPTSLPGNGELRYHFAPRKSVPDDRIFGNISAQLRVDAYDDTNTPTSATTTVTVTR
jgi:hypothetical protein